MTIRKLPAGGAWTPLPVNFVANAGTVSGIVTLAPDDGISGAAFTFVAPVSGTLDTFEFLMGGSFDPDTTLVVSFQGLDSNDKPNGVQEQLRSIRVGDFAGAWIDPGLITDDGTDTGVKRTVTRGEKLACVIDIDNFTAGDVIVLNSIEVLDDTFRRGVGGAMLYNAIDGFVRTTSPVIGCAALKYDRQYQQYFPMPEFLPIIGVDGTSFNADTTPDEVGLEFAFPSPVRIGGATMCLSTALDGVDFDCFLYDQLENVLATAPGILHTDMFPTGGYSYWTIRFPEDVYIPANEPYKITVKPSTPESLSLLEIGTVDTVIAQQTFGYLDTGSNEHFWVHVARTDGGAWIYNYYNLPLISLNITGVDMQTGGATDDWEGDA